MVNDIIHNILFVLPQPFPPEQVLEAHGGGGVPHDQPDGVGRLWRPHHRPRPHRPSHKHPLPRPTVSQ